MWINLSIGDLMEIRMALENAVNNGRADAVQALRNVNVQESRGAHESDLNRVWGAVPYAGGIAGTPTDGKGLADRLAALSEALSSHALRCNDKDNELSKLRAQRDAVRAFLGIGEN